MGVVDDYTQWRIQNENKGEPSEHLELKLEINKDLN